MLLAAAAPPPGMTCFLASGADRAASDSTRRGDDKPARGRSIQARGRNRVNPPAPPDACWACQKLAGDDKPARPSPAHLGSAPPGPVDRRPGSPAGPFRSTDHRLRC